MLRTSVVRPVLVALAAAALLVTAGCGGDGSDAAGPAATPPTPVPAPGLAVVEVVDGLQGPTQATWAPDGRLLVAELAGAERAGTGRVVAIDLDDLGSRQVVVDGLLTPTGIAVLGDDLWIMEQRRLSRGPLAGGDREVVLDRMPFNGRSQGALTATAEGALLYDTSGAARDGEVVPGSGTLWSLVPGGEPQVVATGFKHAYARTVDDDGTLWQTEIADGSFDGEPAPDELVAVAPGDDGGWPRCVGDARPVAEAGATEATCAGTVRPHVVLPVGSTPTSVVVAPWDPDLLLVALWADGEVVGVPRTAGPDGAPVGWEPVLQGVEHPQDLLVDGDRVLVVDHGGGRILALRAEPAAGG